MLKIGEFSRLSRVSVRMLRHYDEIGLLKPVETDEMTSYRYYGEEQLAVMARITALKDMGFALADIVRILEIYDDREKLDGYLKRRQEELTELDRQTRIRLALTGTARRRLREDKTMEFDITVRTIPERYAACVRMNIPRYEDEGRLLGVLMQETAALNLIPDDPCLCAAEFPDEEYREENVNVIVWKTVKGTYPDTEHVRFKTLPAVKVACCVMKGSYDKMPECYAAVISFMKGNGYEPAGPMFNIYHVSPAETSNPDEFVTEVCYPVK